MPKIEITEQDKEWPDPQMAAAIRAYGFAERWTAEMESDKSPDYDAFFAICNEVRKSCDLPEYTRAKFDEGWQYRTVLKIVYEEAFEEFYNLCFGWW